MRITVLDAGTLGEDLSLSLFDEFGEVTVYHSTDPAEVSSRVRSAEVIITNKMKLGEGNLAEAAALKLICLTATGFDNIDLAYCRKRGIAVCNVVGYSTQCVAQVTVSMALSLMTHLEEYANYVRDGSYTRGGCANRLVPVYHEIAGKTWGIVGFGNIGRAVGEVARALGCRVIVNKRTPVEDWKCVDLDTLCRDADIISIHTPLTAETRGMLDRAHIGMMKKDAIVINVARGAVTDEEALADAIGEGRLGGLGVDVYSVEPFSAEHPFARIQDRPNVCLTPHMAWGGYETRVRLLEEIAQNIRAFLHGEHRNRVDL
ncbi:MAG: hydroxyacid dehydrogenase [Clostridia bacterium]|nr:hydroxyacid dehydrogenase [Clostridia bacterium]